MKEYNWREEREKFRPDFQKKAVEPAFQPPEDNSQGDARKIVAVIAGLAVIALIVVGCVFFLNKKSAEKSIPAEQESQKATETQDTATMLAEAAEKNKNAVGLVTVTIEMRSGIKHVETIGTAWAFDEQKFATNAHVTNGIGETVRNIKKYLAVLILTDYAKKQNISSLDALVQKVGKEAFEKLCEEAMALVQQEIKEVSASIVINGTHGKNYTISHYQIHKNYGISGTKFNPDVAVLTIQEKHNSFFKIAKGEKIKSLKAGDPIAFLGFPMENLMDGNVNVTNPVASMQTGNIVAVSDFDLKDAGKDGNLLIRHNLPAAGGASGSPIFNRNGEVVALLYGINIIRQKNGERAPSPAQINLAVRADLIEGMGKKLPVAQLLK